VSRIAGRRDVLTAPSSGRLDVAGRRRGVHFGLPANRLDSGTRPSLCTPRAEAHTLIGRLSADSVSLPRIAPILGRSAARRPSLVNLNLRVASRVSRALSVATQDRRGCRREELRPVQLTVRSGALAPLTVMPRWRAPHRFGFLAPGTFRLTCVHACARHSCFSFRLKLRPGCERTTEDTTARPRQRHPAD
jgi:hypothetical protein